MESYLFPGHYDLVTPDGKIAKLERVDETKSKAEIWIEGISPAFVGFVIEKERIFFNFKSTLAQLGLHAEKRELELDSDKKCASVIVDIVAIGDIGIKMLALLEVGAYIGKLFAADERRRVRDPDYLGRMFGRSDMQGNPLLSLGNLRGSADLTLEKIDGRTVAYLTLKNGHIRYEPSIYGFLPSVAKALKNSLSVRRLLPLHQKWFFQEARCVTENEILLVKTLPLHIRTVFAMVVNDLLSKGFSHTSANILQPNTSQSGDIYELFGSSQVELTDIPLEFYTLEPHREHVFFEDRDQLQDCIEKKSPIFEAFESAPAPRNARASVFVVKGEQLLKLKPKDWIIREPKFADFPGLMQGSRQALMVERYLQEQPSYPFLKCMEDGLITSQGILLSRYFPSPLMKRILLSEKVHALLKGIYFLKPSASHGDFFSHEDRALLLDLAKFAIPTYWVDESSQEILQYIHKSGRDSGMFVPIDKVETFLKASIFGIYGSNLIEGSSFEKEIQLLFKGLLELKEKSTHPLFHPNTPIALITGGGPGAMEVGNRIAKSLGILSCANIVDFSNKQGSIVNEQRQNPFVEAKMTYRLDKLVERQAEFHLDFPLFLQGGIGTDFEYALEEVRRKIGSTAPNPVFLFGSKEHWHKKISSRYLCNLRAGTIEGSEWVSNCFFCVQTAKQALKIFEKFFQGSLSIGKSGPFCKDGYVNVDPEGQPLY